MANRNNKKYTEELTVVRVPSALLTFEDRVIGAFIVELSKSDQYEEVMKMIFEKVYHNVDFFVNASTETGTTIEEYLIKKIDSLSESSNQNAINQEMTETLSSLQKTVIQSITTQSELTASLNKKMSDLNDMIRELSGMKKVNSDLVQAISEIKSSLSDNKELMSKLESIKISGASIEEVVKKSEESIRSTEAVMVRAEAPVVTMTAPPPPSDGTDADSGISEISSVLKSGAVAGVNTQEGKKQLNNLLARMRGR